jgi:S-DNA-T family DNA segregation ATPase FtsK/SpoIIIE
MPYLTKIEEIESIITKLTTYKILWLDTEISDWYSSNPRLSLIQISYDYSEMTYILDVLHKPEIIQKFITQIIHNQKIEKVFHNANFDLKYLGNEEKAKNITCTLKIARKISLKTLNTPNRQLKTLASKLCGFENADTESQGSDWGKRPLSQKQLCYAQMDTVYLSHVHQALLNIISPPLLKKNITTFSVTQVKVAFECPRLFYLNYHFKGQTLFVPPEHPKGIGYLFHQLAEKLIHTAKHNSEFTKLFLLESEQLNLEKIAFQIQQLFYELVFFPILQKAIQKKDLELIQKYYQIWQGIIQLIRYWVILLIRNRSFCQPNVLLQKTFAAEEISLEHIFNLPNGNQVKVIGRFDSLIYDFEKRRFCLVEYKTYQPIDLAAQLAQVALYSYMFKETKNNSTPIDSSVHQVLPTFNEYYYSWEELEKTVYQLIPHKLQQMQNWLTWKQDNLNPPPAAIKSDLCNICPQQATCQQFFLLNLEDL